MRAHTKKHHTDKVVDSSSKDDEESISFEEAMKMLSKGRHNGAVALKGFRNREGLTQKELGELLEIAQTNVSAMERGLRPIGKNIAKRLAGLFKTDYRIFL